MDRAAPMLARAIPPTHNRVMLSMAAARARLGGKEQTATRTLTSVTRLLTHVQQSTTVRASTRLGRTSASAMLDSPLLMASASVSVYFVDSVVVLSHVCGK